MQRADDEARGAFQTQNHLRAEIPCNQWRDGSSEQKRFHDGGQSYEEKVKINLRMK